MVEACEYLKIHEGYGVLFCADIDKVLGKLMDWNVFVLSDNDDDLMVFNWFTTLINMMSGFLVINQMIQQ